MAPFCFRPFSFLLQRRRCFSPALLVAADRLVHTAAPLFLASQNLGSMAQKAFAGIVLGGFGSVKGAIVGCLLIGVIESLGILATDKYRDAIVFLVLIVVLVVRPTGIFGEKISEKA